MVDQLVDRASESGCFLVGFIMMVHEMGIPRLFANTAPQQWLVVMRITRIHCQLGQPLADELLRSAICSTAPS